MSFELKPDNKGTENKSIRFPISLIQEIEEAIKGKDVSFSSFVIQACQFAIDELSNDNK